MGWGWSFGMMNYGEQWKRHRKLFHQHFNQNAVDKYQHIQMRESRALLRRIRTNPDKFMDHIRMYVYQVSRVTTYCALFPARR